MVTDQQVRRLRRLDRRGLPKGRAAAKAGVDEKTARKYRRLGKLPSEVRRMDRDWRTRPDPFAEVWPELEEQLRAQPRTGGQDPVRRPATALPRALRRRPTADLATAGQAVAGPGGAGQGGVLRPGPSAGSAVPPATSPTAPTCGVTIAGAAVRPPGLPLRADLLELGDRHDLLLRELREPQRGLAERLVGTGRRAAAAPHRSA